MRKSTIVNANKNNGIKKPRLKTGLFVSTESFLNTYFIDLKLNHTGRYLYLCHIANCFSQ